VSGNSLMAGVVMMASLAAMNELPAQARADTLQFGPLNDSGRVSSWERHSLCFATSQWPSPMKILKDASQNVLLVVPPGPARGGDTPWPKPGCQFSIYLDRIANRVRISPSAAVDLLGKGMEQGVDIYTLTLGGTRDWYAALDSAAALARREALQQNLLPRRPR
jgi:hypothetical protein